MRLVTFTRDMRPNAAGSSMLVPDDVAARLQAEGAVTVAPDPRVGSAPAASPVRSKPSRLSLPGRRQGYQTK